MIHFPVVVRRELAFLAAAFVFAAGLAPAAGAATTYTWNVNGAASWNTPSNWTPDRTTPAADDILVFDGAITPAPEPTGITTQTIGQLILVNGILLKLQSAAPGPYTLTLSGGTGVDLEVPAGCTLKNTYASPTTMTLALSAGATASIAGRLEWSGQLLPGSAGAVQVSGSVAMFTGPNPIFGNTVLNGVVFQSGSAYEYNGGDPFAATAPASVSVFETGSRFRVLTIPISLPLSGRTISILEVAPGSDVDINVTGSGTLTLDQIKAFTGKLKIQLPQVHIRGNTLSHYQTLQFLSGTTVYMDGSSPQVMQGGVQFAGNTECRITNPLGVTMTSDSTQFYRLRLDGGDLTLPSPGPYAGVFVFTALDLIQGRVHTGSNALRVGANATITGGSASSYVDGTLTLQTPSAPSATGIFPIGDATRYAPVTIQFPSIGSAPQVTVSTSAGDHANIGTAPLNASRSVNRTWNFAATAIPSSSVTFGFDPVELDPGTTTAALGVGRYGTPAGTWVMQTPGTRTPTSTQATGVTVLNQFQVAEPTYTVTASAGAGGTIAPSGVTTLPHGGSQHYDITPLSGYVILDVLVDGVSQGAIGSYDFTNVTASHTISATFQPYFTVSAGAGAGGSIAPTGVTTLYGTGGSQAYTITPNAGFAILDVLVDGVSQGAIGAYTFTNVSANHTIAASFIATYTINASAGAGGSITSSGVTTLVTGASKSYTITPLSGYSILDVTVDGVSQGPLTTYTFTNVTANHTIAATFTPLYTITASAGAGGTIAPLGTTTLTAGSSQSYTITPNPGYVILQVLVDGVGQGSITSYTFNNLAANHTISATFQQVFSIVASAGTGGSVTPAGTTVVNAGSNQSYTIAPNAGYVVLQVQVDGVGQGPITSYSFNNVTANHTINATFQQVFTITATAGPGGTISPSGVTTKDAGASQTYTITPNAGKAVADVLVDGVTVGAVTSYAFTNLSANHTIAATFKSVYTIDATAGVGGTITPSGLLAFDGGTSPSFTIAASPGYTIQKVVVDGISQGVITSYSFTNLSAPHTIYASFTATYPIVATAGSGGFASIAGFTPAGRPSGAAFGDLNGDGAQDIVVTAYEFSSLSVRLGNNTGGFGPQLVIPTDLSPRNPLIGDFDGDNRLDVAILCVASNLFSILYGDGSGGFAQGPKFYVGTSAPAMVAADLNGDGRPDFAIPSTNRLYVYLSTGPKTYAQTLPIYTGLPIASGIDAGDLNGDGKIDLVASDGYNNTQAVLLNNGAGGFPTRTNYSAGVGARAGRLADVNNDGKLDLLLVDYGWDGTMRVILGDGLGGFGPPTSFGVGCAPAAVAPADLNADGNMDAVVVNSFIYYHPSHSVLIGNGAGGFTLQSEFHSNAQVTSIALADFNGDGVLDLAAPSAANYNLYLFSGTGGSISPAGTTAPVPGSNVTYTITPAAGFSIADVKVDGVSQGPLTSYTFNNVTAGHTIAASFVSGSGPLVVGGVANSPEGDASLSLDGNTLVVSGIGNSGNDGVSFGAEDASTGLGVTFDGGELPIDPQVDTGASIDVAIVGNDGNPLGSVETTVAGDGLDIQADYAPIGATDQTVEVWDDGVRVLSMVVPNNETVHRDLDASSSAQRQPGTNRMNAAGDGIGGVEVGLKKKSGSYLAATQKFSGSRPTTVAGVMVSGNEIRFAAIARQPIVLSGTKVTAKSPGGASHFAQLRISDQPAYASTAAVAVGGVTGTPLGGAQIAPIGDDWQMTGIGSSGNDGASLDLTVAAGSMIEFGAGSGFHVPRDAGAQLVHRVRGTIGSNADADIATVTETAWNDSITLRSDFRPLGATSQTIEILNGSTVVASGTYGLDQAVYVVAPLPGPGFHAQAASFNTSRSNLKDKCSLAATGSSDRPTLEWVYEAGGFDLMLGGTRVAGQIVRFRPNDGSAIKAFTSADLVQKNPGVPELATLVMRPVGIGSGANGSTTRASGGAQVVSTDHNNVRLMSPNGSLGAASVAKILSGVPSPRLAVRPVVIANPIAPDTEVVVFTARGRTASATDVASASIAAIRNLAGFAIGPVPDSAGATAYLVEIYSGATRVASSTGSAPVVQAATLPDRVEHRATAASFEGRWDTPLSLTIAGGATISGDRIRIVRVGAFAPLLSLDALTIEAQGMMAIDLTSVDTASVTGVGTPHVAGLALALPRNPMRSDDTKFGITVPTSQHVRLDLFDVSGRRVATLHDGPLAAGTTWIRWEPATSGQHSGVLFARLRAAGDERIQKFTYLR